MKSEQRKNGAAFPVSDTVHPNIRQLHGQVEYGTSDMALRDWFAGQALVGLINNPETFGCTGSTTIAEFAYLLADDMLSVRAGGEK